MQKSQLDRYRSRLLEHRDGLTEAINRMSEIVLTDDHPPEEHDHTVSEGSHKELVLEQNEETIRRQVISALQRLDRGDFGMCEQCGKPIGKERLDAMAYTPHCIDCVRRDEASSAAQHRPNLETLAGLS